MCGVLNPVCPDEPGEVGQAMFGEPYWQLTYVSFAVAIAKSRASLFPTSHALSLTADCVMSRTDSAIICCGETDDRRSAVLSQGSGVLKQAQIAKMMKTAGRKSNRCTPVYTTAIQFLKSMQRQCEVLLVGPEASLHTRRAQVPTSAEAEVRVNMYCLHMQVPQVLRLWADGMPYLPRARLPGRLLRVRSRIASNMGFCGRS